MAKILTLLLILTAAVLLALPACNAAADSSKPTAVATIFCYYDILRSVGGDQIHAVLLLPRGTSPHEYDPPAQAKIDVSRAKLIIKNGLGIDPWIDKLAADSQATMLDISKDATVLHTAETSLNANQTEKNGAQPDAPGHTLEGAGNPHIWLDPHVQMAATARIRDALIQLDPAHEAAYQANAAKYLSELKRLDEDFAATAKALPHKDFIGFHAAYDYLAHRYGLNQVAAVEELPGSGLTPAQAQRLIALIKEKHIKVLFLETAFDSGSSALIVRETGVKTALLQPIETYDNIHDTYLTLMRQNMQNLKDALGQ